MTHELHEALHTFFTNTVPVPSAPQGLARRTLFWEVRDGWRYPWRVMGYQTGVAQAYPCGEPLKVQPCMCGAVDGALHDIGDGLERCVHCGCH